MFNTIGNLLTQDDQVRCFENAARHLTGDGVFVLECRVPTAPARPGHQFIDVEELELDHVELGVCRYHPVTQILDVNHVHIGADGLAFSPIRLRLAYPPEFDLMARIAGLRLRDRWGGWRGEPYTAASWRHISVYERADALMAPKQDDQHERGGFGQAPPRVATEARKPRPTVARTVTHAAIVRQADRHGHDDRLPPALGMTDVTRPRDRPTRTGVVSAPLAAARLLQHGRRQLPHPSPKESR